MHCKRSEAWILDELYFDFALLTSLFMLSATISGPRISKSLVPTCITMSVGSS